MKFIKINSALCISIFIVAGCASNSTQSTTPSSKNTQNEESRILGNPPAGSPFSKLRLGMSKQQVKDLIGQPTDMKLYSTGKAWIPYYFGTDIHRWEYFYKGQGRLTIASDKLYRIIYDPTEDGYNNN